jgi:hypothetical protein
MAKEKEEKKQNTEKDLLLDLSVYPKDEKGNAILPDDVFEKYGKQLPDGTKSESGRIAYHGGFLKTLGNNPERDHEIRVKGGQALQAKLKERRTFAETIEIMLRKKASKEAIETLGLDEDATTQDAVIAAMLKASGEGDTKAAVFIRDTVGEKPVDKKEIDAQIMTENDRKLLEKVSKRLEEEE